MRNHLLLAALILFVDIPAPSIYAQNAAIAKCSQPVIFRLVPGPKGTIAYTPEGKPFNGYPLDELRRVVSACKPNRTLFVLIDSGLPAGQMSSAVASKLQIDNVRYFIQYPEWNHVNVEFKIVEYDSKLPR